jgi:hypothetical protein
MSLLHVRVGADGTFVFESPLGDPFRLDLAVTKSKRQPADEMFSSRWANQSARGGEWLAWALLDAALCARRPSHRPAAVIS